MIRRPEIIRTPFCPGTEIRHVIDEVKEERVGHHFILPSGERLVLVREGDSRELGETPRQMSQGLCEAIRTKYADLRKSYRHSRRTLEDEAYCVLNSQFNLKRGDAFSWARKIVTGDPIVDRVFPHWLFISILARASFGQLYSLKGPGFFTERPLLEDLEADCLSMEDLEEVEHETPPILIGTAVPLLGNFGSVTGFGTMPEYVVLRQRTGKIARDRFSFPGGKSDGLLEITAWEELREEMPATLIKGETGMDADITTLLRRVDFLAVVDQILLDDKGGLCRFLNYVFAFWIAFPYSGGGPEFFIPVKKYIPQIRGKDGDLGGEWRPALFDRETMELADPEVKDNLSPIAAIAMKVVKQRWGHFGRPVLT